MPRARTITRTHTRTHAHTHTHTHDNDDAQERIQQLRRALDEVTVVTADSGANDAVRVRNSDGGTRVTPATVTALRVFPK